MNADEISAKLKEAISAHSDVIAVYLYGSYASGTARSHSDIDVAVLFSAAVPDTLKAEIRLEGVLDQLPGLEKVEVAALNRAPLKLKAEVLETGRRVYCRDDETRAIFEYETMRTWWDLEPWLAMYNREYFALLKERFTNDQRRAYQRARQTLAAAP